MKTATKRPARPKTATTTSRPARGPLNRKHWQPGEGVDPGLEHGFRSGLEDKVAAELTAKGVPVVYEDPAAVIRYEWPAELSKYTPDFVLPNGIIVETKGRFVTKDRQKHKLIKEQHPDKDIRFVFSNSRQRISKTSNTTYAMWCDKYGFKYADKTIPDAWLNEPPREDRNA